jgi:hypothetical protein
MEIMVRAGRACGFFTAAKGTGRARRRALDKAGENRAYPRLGGAMRDNRCFDEVSLTSDTHNSVPGLLLTRALQSPALKTDVARP